MVHRNNTLKHMGLSWEAYLARIRTHYKDADDLAVWCMALFLGKDILQVSETSREEDGWWTSQFCKDWPSPPTTPPLTIGYLNQRHFMALRRKPPITGDSQCEGCDWTGSKRGLGMHIGKTKKLCKQFYDMNLRKQEAAAVHRTKSAERMKKIYKETPEKERERKREEYDHTPTKVRKVARQEKYERHCDKEKAA